MNKKVEKNIMMFAVIIITLWCQLVSAKETGLASGLSDVEIETPDYRERWINATPEERVKIGEEIGEYGGRMKAKEMGLKPIFDGRVGKAIPQGPDQVYYNPKTGEVFVFECKANSSPLNHSFGHKQGTVEHTIKSAERVLKSPKSSPQQKEAAKRVLQAASEGKLKVVVVRTFHEYGKFKKIIIESIAKSTPSTMNMARAIINTLQQWSSQTKVLPKPVPRIPNSTWNRKMITNGFKYLFKYLFKIL